MGIALALDMSHIHLLDLVALRPRYCVHIVFSYLDLALFARIGVIMIG